MKLKLSHLMFNTMSRHVKLMKMGDLCLVCNKGHMFLGKRGSDSNVDDTATHDMTEYVCDQCGHIQKVESDVLRENVTTSDKVTATKGEN